MRTSRTNKFEKAQVLPILVLGLLALIAMAMLLLDGGSILLNKRTAQAAADAGALAGARVLCDPAGGNATLIAQQYAINNGAVDDPLPSVSISEKKITVVATVQNESFFAKLFGQDLLTAKADATAGCFAAEGKGVVPLAFSCEETTVGSARPSNYYDCVMLTLSYTDTIVPLQNGESRTIDGTVYNMVGTNIVDANNKTPLKYIYIIMDTVKNCDDPDIICDFDGDGKDELRFGGDRGWIYLDENVSSVPQDITTEGARTSYNLTPHMWLTGAGATTSAIYDALEVYRGEVVLIPVYNVQCLGDPGVTEYPEDGSGVTCLQAAHNSPWPPAPDPLAAYMGDNVTEMRSLSPGQSNYHIVDFAPFYVSCISKNQGDCPGFKHLQSILAEQGIDLKKDSVIEGYFLDDIPLAVDTSVECGEDGLNLSNCLPSLSD